MTDSIKLCIRKAGKLGALGTENATGPVIREQEERMAGAVRSGGRRRGLWEPVIRRRGNRRSMIREQEERTLGAGDWEQEERTPGAGDLRAGGEDARAGDQETGGEDAGGQ